MDVQRRTHRYLASTGHAILQVFAEPRVSLIRGEKKDHLAVLKHTCTSLCLWWRWENLTHNVRLEAMARRLISLLRAFHSQTLELRGASFGPCGLGCSTPFTHTQDPEMYYPVHSSTPCCTPTSPIPTPKRNRTLSLNLAASFHEQRYEMGGCRDSFRI